MSKFTYLQLISAFIILFASNASAEWQPTELPSLESAFPVWYRCHIQVHDRLVHPEANNERDLWRSSTMLVLRGQIEHFDIFLNGQKIVTAKNIADGESKRFKIPKDILVAGKFNTLVIRSETGSLTEPPMLIDYFNELELGPEWETSGIEPTGAELRPIEKQPAAAFYTPDDFRLSATPLDSPTEPIPGKFVPPAESLAALETDDDLTVEQLLHEPQVAQPTHISFDARGRMWVSQYRQYPYPAGLKMLSRDQYYRSKYDKTPPAPPYHDKGADIISVHQDSDGDGMYDQHKNVLEGLNMANSALRGWGGFWVMNTPYLLFYPDADGDDIPDRAPEVRLAGFGLEDTHSVANGLAWGPDGWLYGGQGSTTTSRVTRPDIDQKETEGVYVEGCMIWRYHPQEKIYEIFADGGGNTFGLSFDAEGRLFSGHNGGGTRGWHHVQEGQFLKQGINPAKFGPPPNPFAFGELQMMRSSNPVVRFSHMSIVVGASAMPRRMQNHFLCADPLHHYLVSAQRNVRGSTYETTDTGFALRTENDITFRPVYLANSPDGSIVIADFCEEYIAHGQNYQGQIDPSSGRIYRLRGRDEKLETDYNLEAKSSIELVEVLSHQNLWHRQTAVRLLQQRNDRSVIPALLKLLEAPEAHPALEALWVLCRLLVLDEELALELLDHPAPTVRAWTIRLLGDSQTLPPKFLAKLKFAGRDEADPEVRSQILSTALRLPFNQAIALAAETARLQGEGGADLEDPNIAPMTWFVFEKHCAEHADVVVDLFEDTSFWSRDVIKRYVLPRLVRRFAEAGTREDLLHCARLFSLQESADDFAIMMGAFDEAFKDRVPPPFPDELLQEVGKGSLSLQIRQGKAQSINEGLAILNDENADPADRLAMIQAFGTRVDAGALPALLEVATTTSDQQGAALAALQIYGDASVGETLASYYAEFPAALKPRVLNLLASRSTWSLAALKNATIPRSDFDPETLARMRFHNSPEIAELLPEQIAHTAPPVETVRNILAEKSGDPYRGEPLFMQRCAACHKLFFKGGKVGPDLTRYQRDDLSTMLVSILDPNAEIREGYENFLVETDDGRLLSGFLAEEDANTITLRAVDDSTTTLQRDQLKKLMPAGRSLMPEGLLHGLDDQQLRDLFAYLKLSQPIIK